MKYRQITEDERYTIHRMKSRGYSQKEIAESIGKHKSSISRELKRNTSRDGSYRPEHASARTRVRRKCSRKKPQYPAELLKSVSNHIEEDWSPEQVSLTFRKLHISSISFSTIYRYVKRDKKAGGMLYTHLRQYSKIKRKRNGYVDTRGTLKGKRPLEARPAGAINRSTVGHFEIDLMHGKPHRSCILTMVCRKSLYLKIIKLENKSKDEVFQKLVPTIQNMELKTISADNGTEWHGFRDIEKSTKIKFYFAKPYHSWERGSNENTNGLIRQYIPKGTSMENISQEQCDLIAQKLNQRPRKILDMNCPDSCYLGKPLKLHF